MASLEPSVVTVPLFRTDTFTATSRAAASTLTTLITKTTMVASTATAMTSPVSLLKSTGTPPLPSAFDSPLATGKDQTPAIAAVTLVAVAVCALILLIAFCYYIFLRFRGKCPACPQYEDELNIYKNGDRSKHFGTATAQESMHDLEKGPRPIDEQAHQHRTRMWAQSLARLESRPQAPAQEDRTAGDQALRRLRNSQIEALKGQHQIKEHLPTQVNVQRPVPAHIAAPVGEDDEATLVDPAFRNPDFNKTHDDYLRDAVAPREAERDAKEIAAWLDIASCLKTRESIKVRAMMKASAKMLELDEADDEFMEMTR